MLRGLLIALLLIAVLAVPLALNAQENESPEQVLAARAGYHPEGIDWDAERGVFVTGSLTEGGVFTVADDGTVTQLAPGVEGLSSTGVHVDAARNRVLVAMPDFGATQNPELPGTAALGAYDLDTGEELFFVDLSDLDEGRDFGNDVTVDSDGNAYVTTSFSGVIYVVDTEGTAEIFLATDDFAVQGFGLNGIDYYADGNFLLVAVAGTGSIYKVPVDDPEAYTQVMLDVPVGIDGMVLGEDGYLYAVASVGGVQAREVVVLSSDDDWASASIVARQEAQAELSPTTLALRDGAVYVVHAQFSSIGSDPPVEAFEIQRFTFDDLMTGGQQTGALSCTFDVEVSSANLRSGPGTGYGVVGYALNGDSLSVVGLSSTGSWLRVQADSAEAWIAASVGSLEQGCSGLPVSAEAETSGGTDNDNVGNDNMDDNGNDNLGNVNSNDNADDNGNDNSDDDDDDDNGNDNDDDD